MWKTPRGGTPEPALLPLVKQSEHPCHGCAKCCLYVAIEIDSPSSLTEYDHVLWYLYHESVSVYRDDDGEWSVLFETRCRNLRADLRCDVYAERPHICRGFDNLGCEVNAPTPRALTFREPAEFLAWLEAKRPRLHAKLAGRFTPERYLPATRLKTARARRAVARKARI